MYDVVCARPDIAQVVSVISRYMSNLGKTHWLVIKWILRYIEGTLNTRLLFQWNSHNSRIVLGYSDSNFVGNKENR